MKDTISKYNEIVVDDDIILRAVSEEEAAALFGLIAANRPYLGEFLPWVASTKAVEDSRSFIRTIKEHRENGTEYGFGMYFGGVLAGHISLMHIADSKSPEIGYWIAEEFSGKGITTRAAQAVTKLAIEAIGADHIVIKARVDNIASNAIPPKLGYTLQGSEREDGKTLNVWRRDK